MNCTGCWNYENCEKRDDPRIKLCFKKRQSICYYCDRRQDCKQFTSGMIVCSEFVKEVKV